MSGNKLAYDPSALRRRMIMTKSASLIIVVEGRETDRWYYDQLCRAAITPKHKRWIILPIDQLTRNLGIGLRSGKSAVLSLFKHARKNDYLTTKSRSHKVSILFCVDSDFDKIIGGKLRSPHLRYTRLPDVEADVIAQSRLPEIVASLLSLPLKDANTVSGNLPAIYEKLGKVYHPIVLLYCIASKTKSNYGIALPRFEDAKDFPSTRIISLVVEDEKKKIHQASSCTQHEFDAVSDAVSTQVARLLNGGKYSELLKGKWIFDHLICHLNDYLRTEGRATIRGNHALPAVVRASCVIRGREIGEFARRVTKIL